MCYQQLLFDELGDILTHLNDPNSEAHERLPQEPLFQCGLYKCLSGFLGKENCVIRPEYPYNRWNPGDGKLPTCDLWWKSEGEVGWLELKTLGHLTPEQRGFFHGNIRPCLSKFVNDLNHLRKMAPADDRKVGVLIGLFDFDDENDRANMVHIQPSPGPDAVRHYNSIPWRGFSLYTTAWIWSWTGMLPDRFHLEAN